MDANTLITLARIGETATKFGCIPNPGVLLGKIVVRVAAKVITKKVVKSFEKNKKK